MRLLAFAFLLATLLCARAEPQVIILSPHWDGTRWEMKHGFEEWHKKKYGESVTVHYRDVGGTGKILSFIKSEYAQSPEGIGVDILFGGGVDPFVKLKQAKQLAVYELPPAIHAAMPQNLAGMNLYDPGQEWFGAAISGFGILTNQRVREWAKLPEVKTWEDLADPRLRGWVSSGDPRQSGSILAMYEIILQAYGWEKGWGIIAAMSGNVRSFMKGGGSSAKEASLGEVCYALAVDSYGWAQVSYSGAENVTYTLPEGVTVLSPDSIAILKGAPSPVYAARFLEFVLGREGQLLWMLPKGAPGGAVRYNINRMCVYPGLYPELKAISPIQSDPFTIKPGFAYNQKLSSQRNGILGDLLGACFIDLHAETRAAWKAIAGAPADKQAALMAEFKAPPMRLDELLALAEGDWKKPLDKQKLIIKWQRAATALYDKIREEAKER